MTNQLIIVALGGNVLTRKGETGDIAGQSAHADEICQSLTPLIDPGNNLVITHGNGPQVGALLLQNEAGRGVVPEMPLDVLVGETEGQMGELFQQAMLNHLNHLNVERRVVTLISHVLVSAQDPAFDAPSKPVGPFYSRADARALMKTKTWQMVEDAGRGWRRVVPSPLPIDVLQKETIRELAESGRIVIALGGGGIPTIRDSRGDLHGIEAVIDKDRASAALAASIQADQVIILTGVPCVYLNYGKPDQKMLTHITAKQAGSYLKQGHFAPGSMKPKIEAALAYLDIIDGTVIITDPESLAEALRGASGTRITRG